MFKSGMNRAYKTMSSMKAVYNAARSMGLKESKQGFKKFETKMASTMKRMNETTFMKTAKVDTKVLQRTTLASLSVLGADAMILISALNALTVSEEDDDGGGT
ncbi:hypothetical protein WA158_004434 [Blastocystis sp. Blastoise]